jgi:hypothetical protein
MSDLSQFFSHKAMKELAKYLDTYNMATQAVAIDGSNAENIQSTGTAAAVLNGTPITVAADAELDISADTEGTESAWATATSYTLNSSYVTEAQMGGKRYKCISSHTSSADDRPGLGMNWETYWVERTNDATNAVGYSIADGYDVYVLITAQADGTLTMWLAGVQALLGTAVCKIPAFDPEKYVAVATALIVNDSGSALVIGTTALTGDITFWQHIGPIFPHPDNLDKN